MATELALGTWEFGGGFGFWEDQDRAASIKTVHDAVRSGIRAFDAAPSYGAGRSEQLLGQQLKRFPLKREELWIASKTTNGRHLEATLSRLCTTYLDLWYLHYPIQGQREILETMAQQSNVRAIGVSNMPLSQLEELSDLPIRWVQVPCNLLWNRDIPQLKAYCAAHGMLLSGYSPLALGTLSGNHDQMPRDGRDRLYCYQHPDAFHALTDTLRTIAQEKGASPSQVAIAWSLAQGFDQLVLGARTKAQLDADLAASILSLLPSEMARLDEASRAICSCIPSDQENFFNHRWRHADPDQ